MVDRLVNSEANKRRIEAVEGCFGISGTKLFIPGRVLVGEGVLTKICRKKPKPRQFFLFNDVLVYGTIIIGKKKYNNQHLIPLEDVILANIPDSGEQKNGWLIKTPNKSFAVYAATPTEKSEWMAHIEKCINDLITRTGKRQSDAHAAVWIPDSDTKKCMHCNKTQFTMINRRHHCRNCGRVTCGNCSKNKFLIKTQSMKPVRVCDSCYESLCKERTSSFSIKESDPDVKTQVLTFAPDVDGTDGRPPPIKPPRQEAKAEPGVPVTATDDESSDNSSLSDEEVEVEDTDAPIEDYMPGLDIEDTKPKFYGHSESFGIEDERVYENLSSPDAPINELSKPTAEVSSPPLGPEVSLANGNQSLRRAAPPPPVQKSVSKPEEPIPENQA
ncbi:Pleckstrin homology domain-containing family F member 2 [Halotydeus destructor]|nr:Pleckstrin homology domain-containing family F member 2 [Halotydeus destructor]